MPRPALGLVGQIPDTLGVSGENQFPLVQWDRMELRLYHLPRTWPGGDRMWIIRRPHDVLDADPIAEEIEREVLLDERQMHVLVEVELGNSINPGNSYPCRSTMSSTTCSHQATQANPGSTNTSLSRG